MGDYIKEIKKSGHKNKKNRKKFKKFFWEKSKYV